MRIERRRAAVAVPAALSVCAQLAVLAAIGDAACRADALAAFECAGRRRRPLVLGARRAPHRLTRAALLRAHVPDGRRRALHCHQRAVSLSLSLSSNLIS